MFEVSQPEVGIAPLIQATVRVVKVSDTCRFDSCPCHKPMGATRVLESRVASDCKSMTGWKDSHFFPNRRYL